MSTLADDYRTMDGAAYIARLNALFDEEGVKAMGGAPSRFKVQTAAQFLGEPEPANDPFTSAPVVNPALIARFTPKPPGEFTSGAPEDWLIRGVLPRAGLAVVYGESGSGKSFLVLDMVAALSRGIEWNDRQTKQCKVTYVAAEGAGGFKKRLRAYAKRHDVSIEVLPWIIADAPLFLTAEEPAAVMAGMLTTGQKDVVVIDVLAAVMPGGNENSGEDMGEVLKHCKLIHQHTGALVILIHHSGKDQTRGARGWSGLRAAADAEIEVTRNGEARKFKVSKLKDENDGEIVPFRLARTVLGRDEFGEESSCTVEFDVAKCASSPARQYRPKEGYETIVMAVVNESRAPDLSINEIVAAVLKRVPRRNDVKGRDQRSRSVETAINKLGTHDLLAVVPDTDETRVRRPGPIQATPDNDPFEVGGTA
jgi:hypothetical protein